jgi:hypothetical protein
MKTEDQFEEIQEPTGKFILDNLPFENRFQTANGLYIHYSDVCILLRKYASQFKTVEPENKTPYTKTKDFNDKLTEFLNS